MRIILSGMRKPGIQRIIDLHRLVLRFRAVERIVYIPGEAAIPENDVDHSFTLAMAAWYLAPYFPELRTDRLVYLALAHDLVEVHSGDTSVFDTALIATKQEREQNARKQLELEWPDFPALHQYLDEYANRTTPEAVFVYALDKIMPIIINYLGEGRGWHVHKITLDKLHTIKKDKVAAHPAIADYYDQLYQLLLEQPHLFHQPKNPHPTAKPPKQ
jgi:putative hydrolase of HD superfamily